MMEPDYRCQSHDDTEQHRIDGEVGGEFLKNGDCHQQHDTRQKEPDHGYLGQMAIDAKRNAGGNDRLDGR